MAHAAVQKVSGDSIVNTPYGRLLIFARNATNLIDSDPNWRRLPSLDTGLSDPLFEVDAYDYHGNITQNVYNCCGRQL